VPFDREGTLRKAEKLLRQGKLDLAIAEYRSVIEDQPTDWNTANTLGDLYFRAGQVEKAAAEYGRIADHLASEGFAQKAVALYKKILKIKPDEERAMWHLGQMAARQGLLVEARAQFLSLAQRRRTRGDKRGEAEVRIRLSDLDGADLETRLAGARARVELGQSEPAVQQLKQIVADLQEKGKEDDALAVLCEAATIAPDDADVRRRLMTAYAARGDLAAARQYAANASELKEVAEALLLQGREDEGLDMLASAAELDPSDTAVRARLVRVYLARGDMGRVRDILTPEVAGSDPELLWTLAEVELRDGRIPEGTALLQRILAEDPTRRDALVILGCSVAEVNPDAGYECVEVAARAAIAADEWGSAAAALNEFVNRVPNHIPALMRLVEICVDGGLEATMHSAQTQLADAYLVMGAGVEARVIAEDLVAREPWDRANIERFRRALELLGEADIDSIIAERLSGQSPFLSTDFSWNGEPEAPAAEAPGESDRGRVGAETEAPEETEPPAETKPPAPRSPAPEPAVHAAPQSTKPAATAASKKPGASVHAIDLSGILGNEAPEHDAPAARTDPREVDLSTELGDMRKPGAGAAPPASLESVLKGVRDQAVHDAASPELAEQHFRLATTYIEMGMTDEAIAALEVATRSIRHRFRAAALLAKLHLEKGDKASAIEWFERAAEAPAPTPAAAHQLLYDLASELEAQGESARALAVFLELQAEAGEYRDLAARLEHLTKVQAGG
jgi:tetratricopeptide (TPR) repeat protein